MNSKILRLTVQQMVLSNLYLGINQTFLNAKIRPYLLGFKNGHYVLNLSYTHLQLKQLISIIINIVAHRQKILIVKNIDFYNLSASLGYENIFYYESK